MFESKQSAKQKVNALSICIPVWGKSFVAKFIDYTLPTILNDVDLVFFKSHQVQLHFFTSSKDQKKLAEIDFSLFGLNVFYHFIDHKIALHSEGKRDEKYRILNYCHEKGMQIAIENNHAFMPLVSDVLLSKGAIKYAFGKIQQGYLAVFVGAIRIVFELYKSHFDHIDKNVFKGWSGDEMVDMALKEIHPKVDITTINTPGFDYTWPDYLYWRDPGQGFVQRGLFLHPLVFVPNKNMSMDIYTIDVNLEGLAIDESFNNIYVVKNSEELVCASICERNEFDHIKIDNNKTFESDRLGEFLAFDRAVKPIHFFFLDQPIFFKRNSSSNLEQMADQAEKSIQTIYKACEQFKQLIHEHGLTSTHNRLSSLVAKYEDDWISSANEKINKIVSLLNIPKIVVYGFGDHTELLLKFTDLASYVVAFSDSNPDMWGKYKQGIRCIPSHNITDYASDVLISSRVYEADIETALLERFGNQLRIFKFYDNPIAG